MLNAFSTRMGLELEGAYRECDARDDVPRSSCSLARGGRSAPAPTCSRGGDTFGAQDPAAFRSDPFTMHAWDVRKPVIAAINGHAVGLGLTLALQTDIRLVADDAKCGIVQNRRGVLPDLRSHWTLVRAVGHARAAEILLTGRMYSGAELAALGVASRALPAVEVLPAAMAIARDIAVNTAPVSVAASKAILWMDPPPSGAEIDRLERARPPARHGHSPTPARGRSRSWSVATRSWQLTRQRRLPHATSSTDLLASCRARNRVRGDARRLGRG